MLEKLVSQLPSCPRFEYMYIPCGVSPDLTVSSSALRSLHNVVRISLQVLLRSSIYENWQYIDRKKYYRPQKNL